MPRVYTNFNLFIVKILKQRVPGRFNITAGAKDLLNRIVCHLASKYITGSVTLCRFAKKITIDSNAIIALTKLWLDNSEPVIDFAVGVWDEYSRNNCSLKRTKHSRAKLFLPPARFLTMFREYQLATQKVGETAYIFLTAIIEKIITEILVTASESAASDGKMTIKPEHVCSSIRNSKQFQALFDKLLFIGL